MSASARSFLNLGIFCGKKIKNISNLPQAPDPKLVQAIRDKIMSYPQVLGTHDLMVHDYGHKRASLSVFASTKSAHI